MAWPQGVSARVLQASRAVAKCPPQLCLPHSWPPDCVQASMSRRPKGPSRNATHPARSLAAAARHRRGLHPALYWTSQCGQARLEPDQKPNISNGRHRQGGAQDASDPPTASSASADVAWTRAARMPRQGHRCCRSERCFNAHIPSANSSLPGTLMPSSNHSASCTVVRHPRCSSVSANSSAQRRTATGSAHTRRAPTANLLIDVTVHRSWPNMLDPDPFRQCNNVRLHRQFGAQSHYSNRARLYMIHQGKGTLCRGDCTHSRADFFFVCVGTRI